MFDLQIFQNTWLNLNRTKKISIANPNGQQSWENRDEENSSKKNKTIFTKGFDPSGDRTSLPISLHIFQTLASTNQKSWELIDTGVSLPLVAIALQQTAGRGQWGRQWLSSTGGLYLSLGISTDLAVQDNPHLVMATAWGIATTLRHHHLPVYLKWFNDLILDRHKLGGIKIETRTQQETITNAVIGVGINWQNTVPEVGINLQTYYQKQPTKYISSLEQLAAITTYGILFGYQYYLTEGIDKLLRNYQKILINLGQEIIVGGSPGIITGVTINGKLKIKLRSPGSSTEIHLSPGQISLGYHNNQIKS